MTRAEADKKLKRIFGTAAAYRVDRGARDQDEREAAHVEHMSVKAEWEAANKALSERAAALAAADVEYQRLKTKRDELRAVKDRLFGVVLHYRFTAGYMAHGFFHVEAQADTWEQVFEKLKEKYPNGKR